MRPVKCAWRKYISIIVPWFSTHNLIFKSRLSFDRYPITVKNLAGSMLDSLPDSEENSVKYFRFACGFNHDRIPTPMVLLSFKKLLDWQYCHVVLLLVEFLPL